VPHLLRLGEFTGVYLLFFILILNLYFFKFIDFLPSLPKYHLKILPIYILFFLFCQEKIFLFSENIPDMVYPFAALRIVSKKKLKQIKEIMKRKAKKK